MSYPKDLDEYTTEELLEEIDRRAKLVEQGLCDYCSRKPNTESCKFPDRHKATINKREYRSGRRTSDALRDRLLARKTKI